MPESGAEARPRSRRTGPLVIVGSSDRQVVLSMEQALKDFLGEVVVQAVGGLEAAHRLIRRLESRPALVVIDAVGDESVRSLRHLGAIRTRLRSSRIPLAVIQTEGNSRYLPENFYAAVLTKPLTRQAVRELAAGSLQDFLRVG